MQASEQEQMLECSINLQEALACLIPVRSPRTDAVPWTL